MSATKEAMVALEHAHGKQLDVSIFCMDVRAFGKEFDSYVNRARDEQGVKYIRAIPSRVVEMPGTKNPRVRYFDQDGVEQQQEFDLVVLSVGLQVPQSVRETAGRLGLDLNEFGFAQTDRLAPLATSRPGLYVAGAFQEPKDIPESVAQASAAAACAMEQLAAARGSLIKRQEYPWERDVTDEAPRIGVFICHCGHNIASVIDVQRVAEQGRAACPTWSLHADQPVHLLRHEPAAHQGRDQEAPAQPAGGGLLLAAHPRGALPGDAARERAEPVPVRDDEHPRPGLLGAQERPVAATEKAGGPDGDGRRPGAASEGAADRPTAGDASALVLGGGLAGMTAALGIADQGFQVHLVEKEAALGGLLREVHSTLEGADVAAHLSDLVERVQAHPSIDVYLNATPASITGHMATSIRSSTWPPARPSSDGGAGTEPRRVRSRSATAWSIIATGGQERSTELYLHGKNPHVITQSKLEAALATGELPPELEGKKNPTVVMIQCVESRNEEHPYCSRVCCSEAVKNAIEIKRRIPGANVAVLGRDIRTYGFRELYFQKAREEGVLFVRHPEKSDPVVAEQDGRLEVSVHDASATASCCCGPTCWCSPPASLRPRPTRCCPDCCAAP